MIDRRKSVPKATGLSVTLFAATVLLSCPVLSQTQSGKLVELLMNSKSHRERIEAAHRLGKYPGKRSQDALLYALRDDDEGVRAAAVTSLSKMGDSSTIPALKSIRDDNQVVQDLLHRAIVLLEEKYPEARTPVEWNQVKSLVEISSLQDRSRSGRSGLNAELRKYMARHFRLQNGFAVTEGKRGFLSLNKVIRRYQIKPFYVMGSLVSLKKKSAGGNVVWEAAVSLSVLDHPGRTVRAVVQNRAEVRRPASEYRREHDTAMQNMAVEEAIRAAAEGIAKRAGEI